MNDRAFVLGLLSIVLLAGCAVTTEERPQSPTDAARYNALLGVEYLRRGELAGARDKIERALSQDSKVTVAHTAAGMLYERLGEPDRAERHYRTATKLDPHDGEVLNLYGIFLCRQGRPQAGEEAILKAARNPLYQTPQLAYTNAGLCASGSGRADDAEKYFQQALQMRPRFPRALAEMAQLQYARGDHAQARAYIQRYIGVIGEQPQPDPELPNVLWLGVRVERALSNPAAADAYGRRLRDDYPGAEQTRALIESERTTG